MSEQKRKMILAIVLASVLVILLGGVSVRFFPAQQTPSTSTAKPESITAIHSTPVLPKYPYKSIAPLNLTFSEGFNSSTIVNRVTVAGSPGEEYTDIAYGTTSPLFVLPPGGKGTVPFLVDSSSDKTLNVSLSILLGSSETNLYGVQFSINPSNFTLSPGEQVQSVLTITADKDAPEAFYSLGIDMQTNSGYLINNPIINLPDLLVANFTPSCLFLEQAVSFPVIIPSSPPNSPTNASAGSTPYVTPGVPNVAVPTIDVVPGETATVIFGCLTQDNLSLNVTVPAGFSSEFSPNPLDIIFSFTSGNMYALTITADTNISSGTYEINTTGSIGTYQFDASFYVVVK